MPTSRLVLSRPFLLCRSTGKSADIWPETQSESVLIQKIYTHFKKAPGTHKLGVLYVVDSVTRSWVEQARKAGQQPGPSAAYGTYGAGVYRVTELLPMLMTDITNSAPEDQKVRSIRCIFPSNLRLNSAPRGCTAYSSYHELSS